MDNDYEHLTPFEKQNFRKLFCVAEMESSYIDYINEIESKKISLGIPSLDEALGKIRPSQVVTFIAGTNVGKTALTMNIIHANAKLLKDKITLLFECEIDQNEIYERLIQMDCGLSTEEVEQMYISRDIPEHVYRAKFRLNNIASVVKRINIDDIIPFCNMAKKISGREIAFIAVDYLGLITDSIYNDEYARVTAVMRKLKEIALTLEIPVINLAQPARKDLVEEKGLNLYSGKSSGEIENSSQIVVTLERINESNFSKQKGLVLTDILIKELDQGKYFLLKASIVKKKQGRYAKTYLLFDTKTTLIKELDG
jgi:replicative DNA helicase